MRVLMITGDTNLLVPGTEAASRLVLQRSVVPRLEVVYWGKKNIWPALPAGTFDVVTVQDPFFRGLYGWYVARARGSALNVQLHADLAAHGPIRRLLARFVLSRADSIRVVSERLKRQIVRYTRAPIAVLPIFLDLSRFRNVKRQPQPVKTILWVGRFEKEKDPFAALALIEVVRKAGTDARLVMLGRGTLGMALRERAKGLPVEFPGWLDPVPYYGQADVLVCTSRHESWGASMIEALAARVPVVAPDIGVARAAGAFITERGRLALKVVEVLKEGTRGELKLDLPTAEEWASLWKKSLSTNNSCTTIQHS